MILDLDRLSGNERIEGDEVVGFHDVSGGENRIHCHVDLRVRRIGETFHIDTAVKGTLTTACHKCLESTRLELNPAFRLVVQRSTARGEPEEPGGGEDFVRLPAGQSKLSLDSYIYECLMVDIPMQIFCRDNCRGLCSLCGRNLNRGNCACNGTADPRWDALRKLKGLRDSS